VDDLTPSTGPTPGDPIRILIVDDDPLVRSGLALILGGSTTLQVVAQAGNGKEGLAAIDEHLPDVVLMDIRMPRVDGLAATEALRARAGAPEGIVLTTFDADEHVLGALAAGADGFVLKDTPPQEIVTAIRTVAAGDPMLSPSVTATLIRQVRAGTDERADAARRRLDTLTEREHDVAVAVGRGLSNAEIAAELYLSVPTVKAHVSRLFDKLHVSNRVQIAICVHDAGLA